MSGPLTYLSISQTLAPSHKVHVFIQSCHGSIRYGPVCRGRRGGGRGDMGGRTTGVLGGRTTGVRSDGTSKRTGKSRREAARS